MLAPIGLAARRHGAGRLQTANGRAADPTLGVRAAPSLADADERRLQVGFPLARQRVTLRLDEHLAHVIAGGQLWRTLPSPVAP